MGWVDIIMVVEVMELEPMAPHRRQLDPHHGHMEATAPMLPLPIPPTTVIVVGITPQCPPTRLHRLPPPCSMLLLHHVRTAQRNQNYHFDDLKNENFSVYLGISILYSFIPALRSCLWFKHT